MLALAVLGGCGRRESLHPAEGKALPPKAAMAATRPSADDLLTPTTEERPNRSEEVLQKSEVRSADRFNLPPQN